ncbi:MAG: hypothetical protein EPN91_11980 [Salinibacterium sp.]|nr:MAG: hypothetical protein EPN91_11980 [Salinibacterium sp.]
MTTTDTLSREQIWACAQIAVSERNVRLLGYVDAALRGGLRRGKAGREACAALLNNRARKSK